MKFIRFMGTIVLTIVMVLFAAKLNLNYGLFLFLSMLIGWYSDSVITAIIDLYDLTKIRLNNWASK